MKSLTLINVGVTIIEVKYINYIKGLDDLNKLEELNLNENSITKLGGFKGLLSLKTLYISHN